ncbi:MAG: histidine phosphatase family protein [Patescibacteria group bacterium]
MAAWIAAVRHPEKQDDIDHIHRGDQALITEEGERQAQVLIEHARLLDIDIVLSSDTPRTALLAARIGEAIGRKVETRALFREWRAPSVMLGRSVDEPGIKELKRVMRLSFDHGMPVADEETRPMLEERNRQAQKLLLEYPQQRVLLVTHAKFICGLITQTIWGTLENYYSGPDRTLKLSHTGITVFVNEPDRRDGVRRLIVETVNDISHTEPRFYQDAERILGAAE